MGAKFRSLLIIAVFLAAIPAGSALILSSHSTQNSAISLANPSSEIHTYGELMNLIDNRGSTTTFSDMASENATASLSAASLAPSFSSSSTVYGAVFREAGLPTASNWYVSVGGITYVTNSSKLQINLTAGSYSYSTWSGSSFIAEQPNGTVVVSNGISDVNVKFISALSVKYTLSLESGKLTNGNYAPVGSSSSPIGILSDPVNNLTYVADSSMNLVYVITLDGTIVKEIHVGTNPSQIVMDPANGFLYVSNSGSDNVSVIGSGNDVVASIPVGSFPFGMSYNPSNGYIYVANVFSGNISVIDTASGAGNIVSSIGLESGVLPLSSVYSPSTGIVYFSDVNGNDIAQVSGTTVTGYLTVKGSPAMMAYDSNNGNVYVTDAQTSASTGYGFLSTINGKGVVVSNITIPGSVNPFGVSFDKNRNLVYISTANSNTLIVFNPVNGQFINSVQVGSEPYGVSIATSGNLIEITNFNSGTVSFLGYAGAVKTVTFMESGLSSGTSWSVQVSNTTIFTTGNSVIFNLTPGTYSYKAASITGYILTAGSSAFTVSGQDITIPVMYGKLYSVKIDMGGIPAGMGWWFTLGGVNYSSSSSSMTIPLLNGTYTITPQVASPSFTSHSYFIVVDGSSISISMSFVAAYKTVFTEQGLSPGTEWSVMVNGTNYNGTTEISVMLSNGTYNFSVGGVNGYILWTQPGTLTVDGGPVAVKASYSRLYTVAFRETGLYPGTIWNITMNGSRESSSSGRIEFQVTNGSYEFSIGTPAGYISNTQKGTVTVTGSSVAEVVAFNLTSVVTMREAGLPSGTQWEVSVDSQNIVTSADQISLNLTNGTYQYQANQIAGYILVNGSGTFIVSGNAVIVSVSYEKLYTVSVEETGLMPGTPWGAAIAGQNMNSETSVVNLNLTNGTYNYQIPQISGYKLLNGSGTFTVSGSSVSVNVEFEKLYTVAIKESGLSGGTEWWASVGNYNISSRTGTVSLNLTNGTYEYLVSNIAGYRLASFSGNLTVSGGNVTVSILYEKLYNITFVETGLPIGLSWAIELNGSVSNVSGSTYTFSTINGTYNFSIQSPPQYYALTESGYANVSGDNVTVHITFKEHSGLVNLRQINVPDGSVWFIQINGHLYSSNGSDGIQIVLPVGNYTYSANYSLYGWSETVSGSIEVPTGGINMTVEFPTLFKVKFKENNLADHSQWGIMLNGYNITARDGSFNLLLPNGTYNFTVFTTSHQSYHILIQYGNNWGHDDYTASAAVSPGSAKSVADTQLLIVNGGSVSVKVIFNQSENGHSQHHGKDYFRNMVNTITIYVGYMVELVKLAASTLVLYARAFYFYASVAGLHGVLIY